MTQTFAGVCPLTHLGVIRAQGADAAQFLHSQLSQDFLLLGHEQARLAAFCNAKGRMQASFIGLKLGNVDSAESTDTVLLICSRDLLQRTLKRLSMFVLRAKCKLSDASADYQLLGLAGASVPADLPSTPWALQRSGSACSIALYPAQGQARALWLAPIDHPAPSGAALDLDTWRWGEVMAGVATVSEAVFEQFVPQMLNYESVGGVSFKKGCYPGQEVVARSQFRGTLKRRAYVVRAAAPLAAGAEVFAQGDSEQPVGMVVQTAPDAQGPQGQWCAIVSMQTQASTQPLQVSGNALQMLPLPYALLEDI